MNYPSFIENQPSLDLPFPEDVVTSSAIKSDTALVVMFQFHKDFDLPEHHHGAQWGTLVHGEVEMTVGGKTWLCKPGDTWDIPAGTPHSGRIKAGSLIIDVFEETDRYPLKD